MLDDDHYVSRYQDNLEGGISKLDPIQIGKDFLKEIRIGVVNRELEFESSTLENNDQDFLQDFPAEAILSSILLKSRENIVALRRLTNQVNTITKYVVKNETPHVDDNSDNE